MHKPNLKFVIPVGTPITALGNVYDPKSEWKGVVTKHENVFPYIFLTEGESERSPETLYEGGMECGWATEHCNTIYRLNVNEGRVAFTLSLGNEHTAVMMVSRQYIQEVAA